MNQMAADLQDALPALRVMLEHVEALVERAGKDSSISSEETGGLWHAILNSQSGRKFMRTLPYELLIREIARKHVRDHVDAGREIVDVMEDISSDPADEYETLNAAFYEQAVNVFDEDEFHAGE